MFLHLFVSHSVHKGGRAWQGGMHGGGHAWQGGVHGKGGMHGRWGMACMSGGVYGRGMHAPPPSMQIL